MEIWPVLIPAILSLGGAVYSAWSARKARTSEAEATRLRDLEQRLSDRKIKLYEEILTALGNLLVPDNISSPVAAPKPSAGKIQAETMKALFGFMNHVIVYGSDDVLKAFSRYRAGAASGPPPLIMIRLVADFMLAIRRDLDGGTTTLTALDMVGMRLNELYSDPAYALALSGSFEDACKAHKWIPPWGSEHQATRAIETTEPWRLQTDV